MDGATDTLVTDAPAGFHARQLDADLPGRQALGQIGEHQLPQSVARASGVEGWIYQTMSLGTVRGLAQSWSALLRAASHQKPLIPSVRRRTGGPLSGQSQPQRAARLKLSLHQRPLFKTPIFVFLSDATTPWLTAVLHLLFEANPKKSRL